jgi:hypothetical protein
MPDQQETRDDKLKLLEEGKLNPKQKAAFHYKSAQVLVRNLDKIKEITKLLKATPDSYLGKIDFMAAATACMELTEVLIEKANPTHIKTVEELTDGSTHIEAERFYTVHLGNSLPGLSRATINLGVTYKPTREEIVFNRRLYDHKIAIMPVIVDHGKYPLMEFMKDILPSIKAKENLKITTRGLEGYKPEEEFGPEPKPVDQKLLDAIGDLVKIIGTDYPRRIRALPDRPSLYDEWPPK